MLSEKQIDLMKHAVGWPKNYRNHYAAEPEDDDVMDAWEDLVSQGLAVQFNTINEPPRELVLYCVTQEGLAQLTHGGSE